MSEINVVPYIDVMLVLLVIFMITAPLLQTGVTVDLPQADARPLERKDKSPEPVIVVVKASGDYALNIGEKPDEKIDAEQLINTVAAVMRINPATQVLVKGDRNANYGQVVYVMTLLQKAGVPGVGLMTDTAPAEKNK
jgi:biopolymer transport protein TolR